jgi:ribonuclease VapC
MVVDTSAIIAIIFGEPEAALFSEKIGRAERRRISAATLVEASIVLKRQTKSGDDRDLDAFLAAAPFEIVPSIGAKRPSHVAPTCNSVRHPVIRRG